MSVGRSNSELSDVQASTCGFIEAVCALALFLHSGPSPMVWQLGPYLWIYFWFSLSFCPHAIHNLWAFWQAAQNYRHSRVLGCCHWFVHDISNRILCCSADWLSLVYLFELHSVYCRFLREYGGWAKEKCYILCIYLRVNQEACQSPFPTYFFFQIWICDYYDHLSTTTSVWQFFIFGCCFFFFFLSLSVSRLSGCCVKFKKKCFKIQLLLIELFLFLFFFFSLYVSK